MLARLGQRYEALAFPLFIFVLLRLLTGIVAFLVIQQNPVPPAEWIYLNPSGATYALTLPQDAPLYSLTTPWHRYDTLWYTKNAMFGYQNDPGIVFLPLYWMLIRPFVALTGGNYVLASLIVSNLACIAAFLLLYRLVVDQFGDKGLARRTLICLAAFPTAYYLMAGYNESLFLALALATFWLALRRQWWLAGVAAFFAAFTRLQGLVLVLPLFWIAYVHYREHSWRAWLSRLPIVVAPPLATGIYRLYLHVNGLPSPDAFYASEWHSSTQFPWVSVIRFAERWLGGQTLPYESDNAVILIIFVSLSLLVLRKLKPYFGIYAVATMIVLLMRSYDTVQFESMFRYVLQLFPCFIVLGMIFRRKGALAIYTVVGVVWQCILLSRFVQWVWVG